MSVQATYNSGGLPFHGDPDPYQIWSSCSSVVTLMPKTSWRCSGI